MTDPRDRTPHSRKARNSLSTKRGTSCSADRCSARNVSNSEATTLYRIVCSGDRISYNGAAADMRPLSQAARLYHLCDICKLSPELRRKSRKSRTMFRFFRDSSIRFPGKPGNDFNLKSTCRQVDQTSGCCGRRFGSLYPLHSSELRSCGRFRQSCTQIPAQ